MPDKDNEEILNLLRKIDAQLKIMQLRNVDEKFQSLVKRDMGSVSDASTSFLILILQIYILIIGYKYLTSTKAVIPAVGVIGAIGISFIILNSIATAIRGIYLSYDTWKKYNKYW